MKNSLFLVGLAGALLLPIGAFAAAPVNERTEIIKSCKAQMYLSEGACTCLADHALAELDAKQRQWLVVGAVDVVKSAALSKSMSTAEMGKIDAFMKRTPDQCAGQ